MRKLKVNRAKRKYNKISKIKELWEIKLKREAKLSRIERSEQIKKFLKERRNSHKLMF